jgi:hypothetical protein
LRGANPRYVYMGEQPKADPNAMTAKWWRVEKAAWYSSANAMIANSLLLWSTRCFFPTPILA